MPSRIPGARPLRAIAAGLALLAAVPGCAALQEIAALRTVTFTFDRISNVRLAGIALGPETRFASLGLADAARLAAAVGGGEVPIELVAHVGAANPASNSVSARMVALDWTLTVEERRALAGSLGEPVTIAPGRAADVPIAVRLDLLELGSGGARDLFDLALSIAGYGTVRRDVRLELRPTIETPLGPMRYPAPLVVRRPAE